VQTTSYRFDREDINIIGRKKEKYEETLKLSLNEIKNKYDCIIIKDHEKGMINKDIIDWVAQKYPYTEIFVDPKYNFGLYENLNIKAIIPNIKEASMGISKIADLSDSDIEMRAGKSDLFDDDYTFLNKCLPNCNSFVIKADKNGAILYNYNENDKDYYRDQIFSYPIDKQEEKSNIGCGDVFDAYFIVSQLKGYTLQDSVKLANIAAGIKRKKELGEIVSPSEICDELNHFREKCMHDCDMN